jgi:hypothetical protein
MSIPAARETIASIGSSLIHFNGATRKGHKERIYGYTLSESEQCSGAGW